MMDLKDRIILLKFYYPTETPWCFPTLYKELESLMGIGKEGFRCRMDKLVNRGLLDKYDNSNPCVYLPKKENRLIIEKGIYDLRKLLDDTIYIKD